MVLPLLYLLLELVLLGAMGAVLAAVEHHGFVQRHVSGWAYSSVVLVVLILGVAAIDRTPWGAVGGASRFRSIGLRGVLRVIGTGMVAGLVLACILMSNKVSIDSRTEALYLPMALVLHASLAVWLGGFLARRLVRIRAGPGEPEHRDDQPAKQRARRWRAARIARIGIASVACGMAFFPHVEVPAADASTDVEEVFSVGWPLKWLRFQRAEWRYADSASETHVVHSGGSQQWSSSAFAEPDDPDTRRCIVSFPLSEFSWASGQRYARLVVLPEYAVLVGVGLVCCFRLLRRCRVFEPERTGLGRGRRRATLNISRVAVTIVILAATCVLCAVPRGTVWPVKYLDKMRKQITADENGVDAPPLLTTLRFLQTVSVSWFAGSYWSSGHARVHGMPFPVCFEESRATSLMTRWFSFPPNPGSAKRQTVIRDVSVTGALANGAACLVAWWTLRSLAVAWRDTRRASRALRGRCPLCKYELPDLAQGAALCPECGTKTEMIQVKEPSSHTHVLPPRPETSA